MVKLKSDLTWFPLRPLAPRSLDYNDVISEVKAGRWHINDVRPCTFNVSIDNCKSCPNSLVLTVPGKCLRNMIKSHAPESCGGGRPYVTFP